jgi:hypothetical protein
VAGGVDVRSIRSAFEDRGTEAKTLALFPEPCKFKLSSPGDPAGDVEGLLPTVSASKLSIKIVQPVITATVIMRTNVIFSDFIFAPPYLFAQIPAFIGRNTLFLFTIKLPGFMVFPRFRREGIVSRELRTKVKKRKIRRAFCEVVFCLASRKLLYGKGDRAGDI